MSINVSINQNPVSISVTPQQNNTLSSSLSFNGISVNESNNEITVNSNVPIANNYDIINNYGGSSDSISTGNADLRYYPLTSNPSKYLISGQSLKDGMGTPSIDYGNRLLKNVLGNTVVSWDGHTIYDSDTEIVMNWDDRLLYDFDGNISIDWQNKILTGNWSIDSLNINSGLITEIFVSKINDESISGNKNFTIRPTVNGTGILLSGEAANTLLPNTIFYTSGTQTVSGNKTFLSGINIQQFINVIGTGYISGGLTVGGHLSAQSKSFLIPHPDKENYKLQYGSLEGPSHSVYIYGKSNNNFIPFPDYWNSLVDLATINVVLTPISYYQLLFVDRIENSGVFIKSNELNMNYYYQIIGERKDIPKLQTEIRN